MLIFIVLNFQNMKHFTLLIFFYFLLINNLCGQTPQSFVLDGQSYYTCHFMRDYIYFYDDSSITKTDYSGNIIWSKNGKIGYRGCFTEDAIYFHDDLRIEKLDTSGNVIWVKQIPNQICPSSINPSNIGDLIVNNNQIYVSILQCPNPVNSNNCLNSFLLLDTAGAVLNSWCNTSGWSNIVGIYRGIPALRGGAMCAWQTSSGIFKQSFIAKVGTNGFPDLSQNNPKYYSGDLNQINSILALPDSNYLVIVNISNYQSNFSGTAMCVKISENRQVLWQKLISSTTTTAIPDIQINCATTDSSGGIYIMGDQEGNQFVMKLNLNGDVQFQKMWTYTAMLADSLVMGLGMRTDHFYYKNGFLYLFSGYRSYPTISSAVLVFDTAFTSSCFSPDTLFAPQIDPPFIVTGGLPQISVNSVSVFQDSSGLSSSIRNPGRSICSTVGVQTFENPSILVNVWPNPVTDKLYIKNLDNNEMNNLDLILYNSFGSIVWRANPSGNEDVFSLNFLSKGIYFLYIKNRHQQIVKRVVKL